MNSYRYFIIHDTWGDLLFLKTPKRLDKTIVKKLLLADYDTVLFAISNNTEINVEATKIKVTIQDYITPSFFLNCNKEDWEEDDNKFNLLDSNKVLLCSEKFMRQMFYLWKQSANPSSIDNKILKWLRRNYKEAIKLACIKDVVT